MARGGVSCPGYGENMTKKLWSIPVALIALIAFAGPVGAQTDAFTIELEGVATGSAGETVVLTSQAVPADLVGAACTGTARTQNNSSVYPGNDIIISSDTGSATLPGVEETPGETIEASKSVIMTENITISMQFGPDGATSGGITLTFDCEPAVISAQATTTTTTPETTTPETTTTVAAAPIGPVDAGAGGTAQSGSSSWILVAVSTFALVTIGSAFALIKNR